MTIPKIGNWGAELGQGLANIGGGLASFINPDKELQDQLKIMMAKDPTLRQKIIDMEAMNPGSTAQMFGKRQAALGQGVISPEAEMEIAQRGLASKSVGDVTNTDTVAAQSYLHNKGIGTKQAQKAAEGQIDYYDLLRDETRKKREFENAKLEGMGGLAGVTEQARREYDAFIRKSDEEDNNFNLAKGAIKKYGGDRQKLVNELADYLSGKNVKPVVSAEEQFALMSDPEFAKSLDYLIDARGREQDASLRWSLANFDRNSQLDIGARQNATAYMRVLQQSGIGGVAYKDLYNYFKADGAEIEKNPELKKVGEVVGSLDNYSSQVAMAQLTGRLAKAMNTLNVINGKIQGSKLPNDIKREEIENAVNAYNVEAEQYAKINSITGKGSDLPTPDMKNINRLFKDIKVLTFKPSKQTEPDYNAEAQAYKNSGGTLAGIDSLVDAQGKPLSSEQKSKMKLSFGKLGGK